MKKVIFDIISIIIASLWIVILTIIYIESTSFLDIKTRGFSYLLFFISNIMLLMVSMRNISHKNKIFIFMRNILLFISCIPIILLTGIALFINGAYDNF